MEFRLGRPSVSSFTGEGMCLTATGLSICVEVYVFLRPIYFKYLIPRRVFIQKSENKVIHSWKFEYKARGFRF